MCKSRKTRIVFGKIRHIKCRGVLAAYVNWPMPESHITYRTWPPARMGLDKKAKMPASTLQK